MILLKRIYRIFIALILASTSVQANNIGELQELVLTGDLYGRSSIDFRKKAKNIEHTVPEGSVGTVLETRKLQRTGSYAIKVRFSKINGSRGKNTPRVGDETWVYFSQKDPWLTFKDKDGSDVDDPEIALISQAKRDGIGLPAEGIEKQLHLPTRDEVLRQQKKLDTKKLDPNLSDVRNRVVTEADSCTTCTVENLSVTDKNRSDIKKIHKEATETKNTVTAPVEPWNQFPAISKYASSSEVEKAISYGLRNKERRSKRLCYRYVKRALLGGELVEDYLPGAKARYGVSDLKRRGFINMMDDPRYKDLIKSPQDAPKGAVLIYRHSKNAKHAGHIEIKTDWGSEGGYVSDFYRKTNTRMFNRELIGVMIKEKL